MKRKQTNKQEQQTNNENTISDSHKLKVNERVFYGSIVSAALNVLIETKY